MRRHPVEDHADAVLVQVIDEVHEILRRAVASGRREVAGRLVAPRAVERMLHDRQQLDVREAQVGHVLDQRRRRARGSRAAVAVVPRATNPRAARRSTTARRGSSRLPRVLSHSPSPHSYSSGQTRDAVAGRLFPAECERVALVRAITAVPRLDVVLVARPVIDVCDPAFPDFRVVRAAC